MEGVWQGTRCVSSCWCVGALRGPPPFDPRRLARARPRRRAGAQGRVGLGVENGVPKVLESGHPYYINSAAFE